MRCLFLAFLLGFSLPASASFHLGTGMSSAMSGRPVPGLDLGVGGESWRATFSAIGTNSNIYYHTSYTASLFSSWKLGSLFWGEIESGLGGGIMGASRGFLDTGSATEEKKNDIAIGPAFFVQWYFAGPAYLKIDMIWGIRGMAIIGLNGQDVIFASLGIRAW